MPRKSIVSQNRIGPYSNPSFSFELSPDLQETILHSRTQVQAEIEARVARDAATPAYFLRLREYIDAAILHQIALKECDEGGYTSSDKAGEEHCEMLWTQFVKALHSQVVS